MEHGVGSVTVMVMVMAVEYGAVCGGGEKQNEPEFACGEWRRECDGGGKKDVNMEEFLETV